MNLASAVIAACAAAAAAIAAFKSWNAATRAATTTAALATLMVDLRHADLTPEFEVTCKARSRDHDSADLHVALKLGRLPHLDEVTVTVLDETGHDHWTRGLPAGVTQEQAEAFVWGPWEFAVAAGGQGQAAGNGATNRMTSARAYSVMNGKNWDVLTLSHTNPGPWMNGTSPDDWRRRYAGKPVSLLITCRRDGYEPWTVPYDVVAEPHTPIRIHMI
jgi:hypothetical protein